VDQKDVMNARSFSTVKMDNAKTADLILEIAKNVLTTVDQNQPANNVP